MTDELCRHADRTVITEQDAAQALKVAWLSIFGVLPSLDSLALLWAQSALETGRWKSIWCYNFGNIKNIEGHPYYMIRCDEWINGKHVWLDPPDRGTWFEAYESAECGAEAYIRFLAQKKGYSAAWAQIEAGDALAFVHALKLARYFTADESAYAKGVVSLCQEFKKKFADILDN